MINTAKVPARFLSFLRSILFCASLAGVVTSKADAEPFVSPMFGDNMVLQQNKANTICGWAEAGQRVQLEIAEQNATAVTGADGRWQIKFLPPKVGGPYTLNLSGATNISFTNILVGDVWLCGGQSNMELPLSRTRNGAEVIRNANHPNIRLFTVKSQPAYAPKNLVSGRWKVCSPETITEDGGFSAVGYFFARKIQSETNIPIGLIKDCLGGTPAESWTSPATLRTLKDFNSALDEVERLHAKGVPEYGNFISHWYDEFDLGARGETWNAPTLDDRDWNAVTIPGGFAELGVPSTPAVCYFRKTITLPDPLPTGSARIYLGVIERMDTTFFNGHWIGASAWVENPRVYTIGEKILKPGKNLITVRVFKTKPEGGFKSPPEQLKLVLGDGTEFPLAGEWKGKLSVDARPPHPLPMSFENWPTMPGVLYDGMIAPVAPFAISGALWYQGEANVGRAAQYRQLLPAMIADWRSAFQQGDFPFYIVSLAAFLPHIDKPGDDAWAELRAAQAFTAATVSNSGLAVTIDIGNANDIHPADKKEVGERLALCALAGPYGRKVVHAGPTFLRSEKTSSGVKVYFANADGGLVVHGDKPGEFAIAGADHKWFWADAQLDGDAVILKSDQVPQPQFIRYAWQANPIATLFNQAGLPAVPFEIEIGETSAAISR